MLKFEFGIVKMSINPSGSFIYKHYSIPGLAQQHEVLAIHLLNQEHGQPPTGSSELEYTQDLSIKSFFIMQQMKREFIGSCSYDLVNHTFLLLR